MQNAVCGMQKRFACLSALCILHAALLIACARPPQGGPLVRPLSENVGTTGVSSDPSPLSQLQSDLLAAASAPGVQRGTWGIVVQSIDRNERLFELHPRALLVPASVAKLASAASAVDAVGWDYRFETTLRTNGFVDNGTLRGDLFIVGSGDPAIGARGGDDVSSWIDALKLAGISRIDGRVIGDDNAIEEPRPALAWAWDDLGYPTGSLFGALNYGENKTLVTIEPGAIAGEPTTVRLDAVSQGRPLVNRSVTGARGSAQMVW